MPRGAASVGLISRKPSPSLLISFSHGRFTYCEWVRNRVWVERNISGYFLNSGLVGVASIGSL